MLLAVPLISCHFKNLKDCMLLVYIRYLQISIVTNHDTDVSKV